MTLAVVMAALPEPLLDILFPGGYARVGGPALAALAIGNVAFSLFSIAGTILNGAGKTLGAIATAKATLVIAVVGNAIAIPMCEPGREVLLVAASVTGGAMLIGAALSGWVLRATVGAFLPLTSLLRVVLATAIAIGAGRAMPRGGAVLTLVEAGAVAVLFLVVLVATRELGRKDLAAIAAVRRSRGAGAPAD
jgi:stage V sporulation protein B